MLSFYIRKNRFFFAEFSNYMKQKQAMKAFVLENAYVPPKEKLRPLKINLKDLVPNFFSGGFPLYECKKVHVEERAHNHI